MNNPSEEQLKKWKLNFEELFAEQRANYCAQRQWDSVEMILEHRGFMLKGFYMAMGKSQPEIEQRDEEIKKLKKLIDENIKDISILEGLQNGKSTEIERLHSIIAERNEMLDHLESFTGVHIGSDFSFSGHDLCDELKSKQDKITALEELAREAFTHVEYSTAFNNIQWRSAKEWLEKAKKILEEK